MGAQNKLASVGLSLSGWFERWFPDAFALALAAVGIVFVACLSIGSSVTQTAQWFGSGFWDLVTFTMQMSMIVVTGYAVATTKPVYRVIERLADFPKTGPGATAYVAMFSMVSSLLSWSFSLIFSALLAREVAHRVKTADYRAIGAAAYLGVGSVWALGLSSSAALLMANPASLPAALKAISGVIPIDQTLLLWQGMAIAAALIVVSMIVSYYSHPGSDSVRGMAQMGVQWEPATPKDSKAETPGEWLEYSPVMTLLLSAVGFLYLAREVSANGLRILLDLNHYIFAFLIVGLLLHWRPRHFVQAIGASIAPVAGVLIQYPLYAGIVKMMTESGLAKRMAEAFVSVSTRETFPVLVGLYSAFLGLFIPSAGGKWLIEAPYLLEASKSLHVHLGWIVQTYNATEALANLIHPFWMLPLLGILGMKPRDIVGYSMLQFVVHVPLVLFLVWALNYTLTYVPPVLP